MEKDRNWELNRAYEERNEAESDAEFIEDEMGVLEREFPESYEDLEEWNNLHHAMNECYNHAQYLTSVIADLEEE